MNIQQHNKIVNWIRHMGPQFVCQLPPLPGGRDDLRSWTSFAWPQFMEILWEYEPHEPLLTIHRGYLLYSRSIHIYSLHVHNISYVRTYVRTYVPTYLRRYVHTYGRTDVWMYGCMDMYMYIFIYILCTWYYIYMHIIYICLHYIYILYIYTCCRYRYIYINNVPNS